MKKLILAIAIIIGTTQFYLNTVNTTKDNEFLIADDNAIDPGAMSIIIG
jgi:uncharacterized protein YxeA